MISVDHAIQILDPANGPVAPMVQLHEALRMGAQALERQKWIPVEDKLPPKDVRVLLCTHDGWIFTGKNVAFGDEIHSGPDGVACWMYLPEPPKGDETENA